MKSILITRPLPDAVSTASDVEALGFRPVVAPVLTVETLDAAWPDPRDLDAVAFTSAHAVAALPAGWVAFDLPVFTVGARTAAAAREAGFRAVESADGDGPALARLLDERLTPGARVFHPHGADTAGPLAGRFVVRPLVIYRTVMADRMPPEAVAFFADPDATAALFYSPRSGAAFATLARDLPRAAFGRVRALCLSMPVLNSVAALGWAEIRCADRPDNAALMRLVRGLNEAEF